MAPIIKRVGALKPLRKRGSLFEHLVRVMTAQQVSVAAADSIFARVQAACGGRVSPASASAAGIEALRAAGCSGAKARAVHELGERLATGALRLGGLARLDDATVYQRLLSIRGLGPWSVEMVLMFRLGRADVFSPGDVGLRRAIERLNGIGQGLSERDWKAVSLQLAERWRPHRSSACRYLWAATDGDIVY